MKLLLAFSAACVLLIAAVAFTVLREVVGTPQESLATPRMTGSGFAESTTHSADTGAPASAGESADPPLAEPPPVALLPQLVAKVRPAPDGFADESVHWAPRADPDALRRLRLARDALAQDPNHPGALRDAAHACLEIGAWQAAGDCLTRLRHLDPHDDAVAADYATTLVRLGRWVSAIEVLQELTGRHPQDARAWSNLATAHVGAGHLSAAATAYERVLALEPDNADAHARRGEVLCDLGDWAAAAGAFEAAAAHGPSDRGLALNLALAYARLERFADAACALETALAHEPRDVELLNRAAALYADWARQTPPERAAEFRGMARKYAEQSLGLDPQQPAPRRLLEQLRRDE